MNPLKIIGITIDQKIVFGGAFEMEDTIGFPLDMSLTAAQERNAVISITDYFDSAINHGRDDKWTFNRIEQAHRDARLPLPVNYRDICIANFMQNYES